MRANPFHTFIRWCLGLHGVIHVGELVANTIEHAWVSAGLSLVSAAIMLPGAFIDQTHH